MHLEALTDEGKVLLPYLKSFNSYYLAGGTAIALQIGHRISYDFDFFINNKIPTDLLSQVKKKLPVGTELKPTVNNSEELTMFVKNTKITFLYYPFPLVRTIKDLEGLKLLSLPELAATKAYTIGRRGEYKDYIDLYYLLSEKHVSIKEILKIAKEKYSNDFNDRLFLEQLIYLQDINTMDVVLLKDDGITKEIISTFFEEQIKKIDL